MCTRLGGLNERNNEPFSFSVLIYFIDGGVEDVKHNKYNSRRYLTPLFFLVDKIRSAKNVLYPTSTASQ